MVVFDGRTPEQVLRDRITELEAKIAEYQAAIRKVDHCCQCLSGPQFDKLDRGKEEVCKCGHGKYKHSGWADCFECDCMVFAE